MTDQLDVQAVRDTSEPPVDQKVEPGAADYRYPGAPPFADSDMDRLLFRGRAKEIDQVLHSILSFDLFLIYAISGLGKSSLVSAGVMQPLRDRDFFPVIVRLNDPKSTPVELIDAQLRESASKIEGITVMRNPAAPQVEGTPSTLWDLLTGLEVWKGNTLQHLVLVFDQFEELFTLGWNDEQRNEFIRQFGQVIRRHRNPSPGPQVEDAVLLPPPAVKVVLIIREDFLGELEAMAQQVPQIMRHRFRVDGLSPEQAELAIREPALVKDPRLASRQFTYTEGAAQAMLGFLGARQDRGRAVLTHTIDPSQLQIICQHVERSILLTKAASDAEITEADLGGKDGLDRILRDFYRREIMSFPAGQRKIVRNLCETGLINQRGRRLSLEEDEIGTKYKVSKPMLEDLVSRRLLRAEPRVGSTYYELAHDTLAAPILAYRVAARAARRRRIMGAVVGLAGAVLFVVVLVTSLSGKDQQETGPRGTPITVGQPVQGTIESSGQSRVFAFDAPGNQAFIVEAKPKARATDGDASSSVSLKVIEPDGRTDDATNGTEDGAQSVVVDGTKQGRYLVVVSGLDSTTGAFELSARPADVTQMQVGVARPGTIDGANPVRVLAFDVADGQPLIVEATPKSGNSLDPLLEVIDPEGTVQIIDSGGEGDAESAVLDSTVAGRYLVVVSGFQGSTGDFELSVSPADVKDLAIDEGVQGSINDSNPVRMYAFESSDGQPFNVEVKSDVNLDAAVRVTDPDGHLDAANFTVQGGTQNMLVDGSQAGRYIIAVSGESSGAFEVTVHSADEQEIVVGGPAITATIAADDSPAPQEFTFERTDDQPLLVEVEPDTDLDVALNVGDSNGPIDAVDSFGPGSSETLVIGGSGSGQYQITVSGQSSGTFTLTVRPADAQELVAGEAAVEGSITELSSESDTVFTFVVTEGQPMVVEVLPDEGLDTVVVVTDPNGTFKSSDANQQGGPESLVVDGSVAGRYMARVFRSDQSGDGDTSAGVFDVSVAAADTQQIVIGASASGTIDSRTPAAVFQFDATAGQALIVDLKPDFSGVLEVIDPGGQIQSEDNDFEGGDETVVVGAPVDGRYTVIVSGPDSSGGFELSVGPLEEEEMAIGQTVSATIEASVVYEFEPSDPQALLVEVTPDADLDATFQITDPTGVVYEPQFPQDGNARRLAIDGTAKGRYIVTVSGNGSTTGGFTLSLTAAGPKEIADGEPQSGTISETAPSAVFEFKALKGKALTFEVKSSGDDGLDAALEVTEPDGTIQLSNSNFEANSEEIGVDRSAGGRYLVVVSGADSTTGDFTVSVHST